MARPPRSEDSPPVVDVMPLDDEERHTCCPLDPLERAEPTPPEDLKHPHKPRCPQSARELYQNRFEDW